mgnify:CR=1 FL=1
MKTLCRYSLKVCLILLTITVTILPALAQSVPEISPAQKEQLKSLAFETKQKIERRREELMRARWELFRAYQDYELDERKVKAIIDRINKLQLDLLNVHLENQTAIRRVLNEDQFRVFWNRMTKHMGGSVMTVSPQEDGIFDRFPNKNDLFQLDLNHEQIKLMKALVMSPRRRQIIENLRRNSRRMLELYARHDLDISTARKLIDSIHEDQIELAVLTHKKQQAIRSILTKSQFEKYIDLLSKRVQERKPIRRKY